MLRHKDVVTRTYQSWSNLSRKEKKSLRRQGVISGGLVPRSSPRVKSVTAEVDAANCRVDKFCLLLQSFGNFSSVGHFKTPPALGSETIVYVLDTADMGHAEPDGSNEWEDDLNARLYNAPGDNMHSTPLPPPLPPFHPSPPLPLTPLLYWLRPRGSAVNHAVLFNHARQCSLFYFVFCA